MKHKLVLAIASSFLVVMIIVVIYHTRVNLHTYDSGGSGTNYHGDDKEKKTDNNTGRIVKVMKSISRDAHVSELKYDGITELLSNKSLQRVMG